jgi:RNA polymerase sigma-70 factor, ECF subfamily
VNQLVPHPARVPDTTIERAIAGDRDARADLVLRYGPLVYSICRRLAPDPDDCYQEIWEKVFGAIGRFDPGGPATLSTWIATIAQRHLIDRHRRKKVRGIVLPLHEITDETAGPYQLASESERRVRLEKALGKLTEEHRRVVILHHVHEVPLEDVATGEGVALGTIKSRLHRARAHLASFLAERP